MGRNTFSLLRWIRPSRGGFSGFEWSGSGTGMSLVIGLFQALGGDVRIDLGGGQMRVPQEFLHAAQVGPGVQHVRGVGMAEFVRRQMGVEPRCGQVDFGFSGRTTEFFSIG